MIKAYAAFEAKAKLQPFEYEPGPLLPDQVELEVHSCGVCHSDLNMIDNDWEVSRYPLVPGHEVVGQVIALGSQVQHLSLGEMVGLGWQSGFCNVCQLCHAGDHNLCLDAKATIVGGHGGFADKVRASANSVVPIPEGIDLDSAGPMFCAGSTVFNPLLELKLSPLAKVAVIGIGGLGHLAVQFLHAWGCEVTAFTSNEQKREQALRLGAHQTLDSCNPEALAAAKNRFDLIISTVNVTLDWNLYLSTLRPRGRLHFVGIPLAPLGLNIFPLLDRQLSVSGSTVGSPATMRKMLEFAKQHQIRPQIETFRFDEVNAALDHLRSGKANYRVVLKR